MSIIGKRLKWDLEQTTFVPDRDKRPNLVQRLLKITPQKAVRTRRANSGVVVAFEHGMALVQFDSDGALGWVFPEGKRIVE